MDNLIYDLMQIIGHNKTDPLILTAVCKLTLNILEQEQIKTSVKHLKVII